VIINPDHWISIALRSNESESTIHSHEAMLIHIRRALLDGAGACPSEQGATAACRELQI
jgi:hypothetical protein